MLFSLKGLFPGGGGGGVLGKVSDRNASHRPSTRNTTRVKKGGRNYKFCAILMKNKGRNTTFSSFLLKYSGQNTTFSSFLLKYRSRNYTNFPETWKGGSKWRSIYSNHHRVSPPPRQGVYAWGHESDAIELKGNQLVLLHHCANLSHTASKWVPEPFGRASSHHPKLLHDGKHPFWQLTSGSSRVSGIYNQVYQCFSILDMSEIACGIKTKASWR